MKCHYCNKLTEKVVKFADGIKRPFCGCANKVYTYDEHRLNRDNPFMRCFGTRMRMTEDGRY